MDDEPVAERPDRGQVLLHRRRRLRRSCTALRRERWPVSSRRFAGCDAECRSGTRPPSDRVPVHRRALSQGADGGTDGDHRTRQVPAFIRVGSRRSSGRPPGIRICIANLATHTERRSPGGRGARRGRSDQHGGRAGLRERPGALGTVRDGPEERLDAGGRRRVRRAPDGVGYSVGHNLLA